MIHINDYLRDLTISLGSFEIHSGHPTIVHVDGMRSWNTLEMIIRLYYTYSYPNLGNVGCRYKGSHESNLISRNGNATKLIYIQRVYV